MSGGREPHMCARRVHVTVFDLLFHFYLYNHKNIKFQILIIIKNKIHVTFTSGAIKKFTIRLITAVDDDNDNLGVGDFCLFQH